MATQTKRQGRKRNLPPEPEHTLLRTVDGTSGEAITDVLCDIVSIMPKMTKHFGKHVACSLMCSRQHARVDDPDEKGRPRIGKGQTVPETPFLLKG